MNFFRYIIKYGRIFSILVIVLPIVAGIYAYDSLPKEGEPEITAPVAIIIAPYAGASPSEIESLITNPIEETLADLKKVKEMRSASLEGVSIVTVEFDVDAELDFSMQKVREKVVDVRKDLPDDAEDPSVEEITLSDLPIMLVSIVGDLDPIRLKKLAEDVADELELMPEVLSTDVAGGLTREIQINLDPEKLNQYGLTILDAYNAVKQSDINIPGGLVNVSKRRYLLRTLTEVKNVADYERIPLIQVDGQVVFLSDVAKIIDGHSEDISYSHVDGKSAVSIAIKKRAGANILETSTKIRDKLKELEKDFPPDVTSVTTADQAKFIQQGFDIMNNSAVTGLIIVIIVLYFAMGLRNSLITSLSIPLSLLLTFVLLKVFGLSNNNIVRFSLVLCIGLLVDNAIIVVENAYHHYQLGKGRLTAVIDGTSEIALPVISATLTTMAAFLPILLMTGTMGEYMSYLPKTVTIALSSSLIVALIANPLVLSKFMKQTVKEGRVVRPEEDLARLKKLYVRGVSWALNHRFLSVMIMLTCLFWAVSLIGLKIVKVEMFPDIDFDFIYITVETPPGTDVETTKSVATRIEQIVKDHVPEVVRVVSSIGYKSQSAFEVTVNIGNVSNFAEVTLELLDGKEYSRATHLDVQHRIRPYLEAIPGAQIRFRPLAWGPPSEAPIIVKIFGKDIEILRELMNTLKKNMSEVPGTIDIKDDFSDAPPELRVNIDRDSAARLGVPLNSVAMGLRGATAGLEVREFRDEMDVSRKYDLIVRYLPEYRDSPQMLDKIKVRSQTGALIPLSNIATFSQGAGVNAIRHADRQRVVKATAKNEGRSAVEITQELKENLADVKLPDGYSFDFEGDYKETEESFASLKLAYVIAFLLIFTLLVTQFNSFFQPFAVMAALPLSIVGAMIGLLITGNNFSIMSFIGLVGLTGIVVNDSIVLVDCINRMRSEGMSIFDAIIQGGQQRLRPIISTTLTTIGGIITLTITDELWEGLGVVIIFGIAFATILTLVVVPVMYSLFEAMGYHVKSAFMGPRFKESPQGKSFFFVRRQYVLPVIIITSIVQVIFMVTGISQMAPPIFQTISETVLRAPTLLKLAIETLVFLLSISFEIVVALIFIGIPSMIGLVVLMSFRTGEERYIDVTPNSVTITSPFEKIFLSPEEITSVSLSPNKKEVKIQAGLREIKIHNILEITKTPSKIPLRTWLKQPLPDRKKVQNSILSLNNAVKDIIR